MESNQPKQRSSDEIDLLELFVKIVSSVRNNFVTILVSFFIGTILGLVYFQFSPNVYESNMLISSDLLTQGYSKWLIEESNSSMINKLNLPNNRAGSIVSIEITSVAEYSNESTESSEPGKIFLNVEARVADNSIWPQLQNSIISYFQDNEFVKVRAEQRKRYNTQMIEKLDLELADLEKLRTSISSGTVQSDERNPILFDLTKINTTIVELNEKKIKFQNSLEIVNSVQLVEGFAINDQPAGPLLSLSLAGGFTIGLFFAAIVVAFKAIRSMLRFSEQHVGKK